MRLRLKENFHQFNFKFHKEKEMVDFHKSILMLVVIMLMSTVASAAIGPTIPFTCDASTGVPPTVRSEGITELMGDMILTCTGGTPTPNGQPVPQINFRIWLNVNVTSRMLDGNWLEAIMAIDEPLPGNQVACADGGASCPLVGIGEEPGINYAVPSDPANLLGAPNNNVVHNIYQGYLAGPSQVDWLGVPVDPPGTQAVRIIRITNVRGNATERGVISGSYVPLSISMYISTIGSQAVPIDTPTQIVAWVQDSMSFTATSQSYLQCVSEPCEDFGTYDVYLRYSELFATAFKISLDDAAIDPSRYVDAFTGQPVLGWVYNTETGWYNPGINPNGHNIQSAGLATAATAFRAEFQNIPAGVTLSVGDISYDPLFGCTSATGLGSTNQAEIAGGGSCAMVAVTQSSGAGSMVRYITVDNPSANDKVYFGVDFCWTSNTTTGIPALGTASVNGSYDPLSSVFTASTGPVPRFIDDDPDEWWDIITINSCATNLLYVYVTNQAGFDTGMVISNTSLDPFGTATQEGACTIYYYGTTTGGGAAPAPVTTPTVPAGEQAIWTLSSGGTVVPNGGTIAAVPGFQGYAIAHCEFQYAHGYAYISDIGNTMVAQGYQALVMDEQMEEFSRTGSTSELLAH